MLFEFSFIFIYILMNGLMFSFVLIIVLSGLWLLVDVMKFKVVIFFVCFIGII